MIVADLRNESIHRPGSALIRTRCEPNPNQICKATAVLALGLILLLIPRASFALEPFFDEAVTATGFRPLLQDQNVSAAESALQENQIWSELRQNLHISGFFQNTSGVFINTKGTRWQPHTSLNSLEAERQLLQIDINESFGEHFQFFMRLWGAYEPPYPFENNARIGAHNLSDFYNEYGWRDLWLKSKWGPLTIFTGRQIVEWGESLAFRICDQINPQDVSYAFGFANLEQSHMPIYMLHPILNLPRAGLLSSNFAELVYAPGTDLLWNHVDYPDQRFVGQDQVAGRVDILPSFGSRFFGGTDTRVRPGESVPAGNGQVLQPPLSYVVMAGQTPNLQWAIPRATWANSQIGFRLHTLIDSTTEAAIFYWRSFDYTPALYLNPRGAPGTMRRVTEKFPHYESFGATMNRPLPMPMSIANELPLILRAEVLYKNHEAFSTSDRHNTTGIVNSDTLNTLVALDADNVYVPWLTSTGNLTANLEWQDLTILGASDRYLEQQGVLTKAHKHEENLLANVSTSWWWGAVAPNLGAIYNPDGTTFLLTPSVTLTPPWTNKYFVKLGSVYILGNDKYAFSSGGSLKGLNNMFVQFQYNFNLL
jgi:hypothetical protein